MLWKFKPHKNSPHHSFAIKIFTTSMKKPPNNPSNSLVSNYPVYAIFNIQALIHSCKLVPQFINMIMKSEKTNCLNSIHILPFIPFKVGHVIPLLKKPDMDIKDPASYRPITNLMTISKVVERVVFSRLQSHMHQSENFNTFQSAYRSGYSTETALLKVTDDLNASMDSKSGSILLSLDISAAFDMIDIDILLPRLESEFGIIGSVTLWIRSYLTDRECYVAVGGSRSVA